MPYNADTVNIANFDYFLLGERYLRVPSLEPWVRIPPPPAILLLAGSSVGISMGLPGKLRKLLPVGQVLHPLRFR